MRTTLKIAIPVVVLLIAAAGAGLWWFFRDDAPAEVSLEAATQSVTATSESAAGDGTSDATASTQSTGDTSDLTGTWSVDTTSGDFDYESATGSFVGFRIDEELRGVGETTAVGRTGDVTGTMSIEGTTVVAAQFDIDMTTITTNDSRRDDNVQDALETGQFPSGNFTLAEPIDLGAGAADGQAVAAIAVGDLTIHGVTQRVEIPLEAQLVNGTAVVVGSIDVVFADYDVEVPDSGIIVSVEDHGILELQLLLTR